MPNTLGEWKDALAAAQSFVTICAIVLGGAWAYFKLIKGRVFTTRLEMTITGRLRRNGEQQFAVVSFTTRNVGQTRVDIDRKASSIELFGYPKSNYVAEFHFAVLESLGIQRALSHSDWVEPGESLVEELIFALPPVDLLALKVHLRLVDAGGAKRVPSAKAGKPKKSGILRKGILRKKGRTIEWVAVGVIFPEASVELVK